MSSCIRISDPTLQAIADLVLRHGTVYNDGSLYALPTEKWEAEVGFHPVFGNHLSLSERAGPRRLIWTVTHKTCNYRQVEGQPSEAEAVAIAKTILDPLRGEIVDEGAGGGQEMYWWLAVNGPSCAACGFPLPSTVKVHPTPGQLIGFPNQEEQVKAQRLLLTAPIKDVKRFMERTLSARICRGEVAYIRPDNPEPPTHGQTIWVCSPINEAK